MDGDMRFQVISSPEASTALGADDQDDDSCDGCGSPFSFFRPQYKCSQCDRIRCHKCLVEKPHSVDTAKMCGECLYGPKFNNRRVGVDKQVTAREVEGEGGDGLCRRA